MESYPNNIYYKETANSGAHYPSFYTTTWQLLLPLIYTRCRSALVRLQYYQQARSHSHLRTGVVS